MAGSLPRLNAALARASIVPGARDRLRELADRDMDDIWNSLKALARFGQYEGTKLEAIKTMLLYAVGSPEQSTPQGDNAPPPAPTLDLSRLTVEELQAIKILQDGQRRRLESGE